jgi:hypothetical protein
MSIKLSAAVAVIVTVAALVGSSLSIISMASGPVAQASTMSQAVLASTTACGSSCTSPVNEDLGTSETPTISISGTGCPAVTAAGLEEAESDSSCTVSVAMAATSTASPGQDWVVMEEGLVSAFVTYGALSPRLDIQYSGDEVVEFEAAPDGDASDLCLSVVYLTSIALQPCGGATNEQVDSETGSETGTSSGSTTGTDNDYNDVQFFDNYEGAYVSSSTDYPDDSTSGTDTATTKGTDTTTNSTFSGTAWILDAGNTTSSGYLDVISGTSQVFSDPNVLTSTSIDGPLETSALSEVGGVVNTAEMWAFEYESSSAATLKKDGVKRT